MTDHATRAREIVDRWAHDAGVETMLSDDDKTCLQGDITAALDQAAHEAVRFVEQEKATLLQEFCNLQVLYGEQKHEIRQLKVNLSTVNSNYLWRSVYPTKAGYWCHNGPDGVCIRRVVMAPIGYRDGLWPHDKDTHEPLWNLDGEWAGPIPLPREA